MALLSFQPETPHALLGLQGSVQTWKRIGVITSPYAPETGFQRETAKRTHRVLTEFEGKKNSNYVMTHDDGFKAYHKSVFGEPIPCEFEGHTFCAPQHPEGFLSVLYGDDFMTPPPVEKRDSHFHDYCDLNHGYAGVDIKELKAHYEGMDSIARKQKKK